jgi:hypothetical protein
MHVRASGTSKIFPGVIPSDPNLWGGEGKADSLERIGMKGRNGWGGREGEGWGIREGKGWGEEEGEGRKEREGGR